MSAPASAGGRIARAFVWWLLLVLGLLALATVARVTYGGGAEVERVGTASVRECVEHGPVSLSGLGTVYTCTAQVRWSDGDEEVREFPAGQLGPADIGREVPVYLDIADGVRDESELGRNGSARFAELGFPATVALGFVVLVLGIGALYTTYRVVRPERGGERPAAGRKGKSAQWPVSAAEVEAVPVPRLVVRLRLLAAWCALAALAVPLSTVPRFDAERAERFVSPWPQIERALLVDVPASGAIIIGLILAVLLFSLARLARQDAARVVKYGPAYLGRDLTGKGSVEQQARQRMETMAATQRRSRAFGATVGALLLALAGWATMRAIGAGPSGGPPLVWLACVRDALLLACLAALWLSTVETRYRRLERLLDQHSRTTSTGMGTTAWRPSS